MQGRKLGWIGLELFVTGDQLKDFPGDSVSLHDIALFQVSSELLRSEIIHGSVLAIDMVYAFYINFVLASNIRS